MHLIPIFKKILVLALLINLVSCFNKNDDQYITVDEWFNSIITTMNLDIKNNNVQTLLDWEILNNQDEFNLNDKLSNDLFAKTILRITKEYDENYLENAFLNNIIKSKNKDSLVKKDDALAQLDLAIVKRNNQTFSNNYEFVENPYIKNIKNAKLEKEHIIIYDDIELVEDNIIKYNNEYFIIRDIIKDNQQIQAKIEPCDILEAFESIDISDSFEVDFSKAEIIDEGNQDIIINKYSANNFDINPLSLAFFEKKTIEMKGYKIEIKLSNSQLVVDAKKELSNGMDQYIKLSLNNLKPSFKFKMNDQKIQEAYLKVDFDTIASGGIKNGIAKDLYADFKNVDSSNFLTAAKSLFKKYNEVEEATIPLCTIAIPIPQMPILKLMVRLQLNIYASGRAEITLSNDYALGMEVLNGNVRLINDHDHKCDFVIKSTVSLMSRLFFSLNAANMALMDIYAEPGIKGLIQSQVHIYDSNNEQTILQSDLPLEFLDDASNDVDDVLVCGDIKAYLVLNVGINSNSSLLGKLNLRKNFSILNERNAPLINDGKYHIENWHFVDKCTRNRVVKPQKTQDIMETTQITIKDYSLIVEKNKQIKIEITGLPNEYSLNDLAYTANKDCVSVDSKGIVTGIERGSSIITIQTNDGKYKVECHVLVKGEQI